MSSTIEIFLFGYILDGGEKIVQTISTGFAWLTAIRSIFGGRQSENITPSSEYILHRLLPISSFTKRTQTHTHNKFVCINCVNVPKYFEDMVPAQSPSKTKTMGEITIALKETSKEIDNHKVANQAVANTNLHLHSLNNILRRSPNFRLTIRNTKTRWIRMNPKSVSLTRITKRY